MSDPKRMSECLNHSAVDTWSNKDVSFKGWVDGGNSYVTEIGIVPGRSWAAPNR